MIGKIPTWWENSVRGRKKVFRCMDHLVLRHPSYMRGFTFPFSLSVINNLIVFPSLSNVNIFLTSNVAYPDLHGSASLGSWIRIRIRMMTFAHRRIFIPYCPSPSCYGAVCFSSWLAVLLSVCQLYLAFFRRVSIWSRPFKPGHYELKTERTEY